MNISFTSLITDTLTLVDNTTSNFVQQAYNQLGSYVNGLILLVGTLYVANYCYKAMHHQITLNTLTISRVVTTLIVIVTLATSWDMYYRFVYNIFTNESSVISQALAGGSSQSTIKALDTIWQQGCDAGTQLFGLASWKNLQYLLYGAAVYVATFLNCIYALSLLVYAKMALAVILGIGQLFILLMLFDSTRDLTSGWIKGLFYFALIPIITTSILLLTNVIATQTLPGLKTAVTAGDVKPAGLLPYVMLSIMNGFLLKQVLTIASLLSGSVSLEGIGNALTMARNGIRATSLSARNVIRATSLSARTGLSAAQRLTTSSKTHRSRKR